jgi:hypothetical protein
VRRLLPISLAGVATLASVVGVASCGDGGVDADAEAFCRTATEQQELIVDPPMSTEDELESSMEFYRLMGELAPLAITEDWNVLVTAMETASTVVPGDAASEQLAAMTAYAAEPNAYRVKKWLLDNCGLDIPITTIAPQEQAPARTTTTTVAATDE